MKAPGDELQKMSNFSKTISKLFGPRKKSFSGRPFPKKILKKIFKKNFQNFFWKRVPGKTFFPDVSGFFTKPFQKIENVSENIFQVQILFFSKRYMDYSMRSEGIRVVPTYLIGLL